jgi:hypothetical protein
VEEEKDKKPDDILEADEDDDKHVNANYNTGVHLLVVGHHLVCSLTL